MPGQHIHQLPADVIGQIAAGEVVERPSAAIKELVENSMDAGASAISVEIRDGGVTSLRVVDNGNGIPPGDIRLAFARHATSKISRADDLTGVRTLGFRGEALASIAAVAKVTCTTRMRGAEYGVSVRNQGGVISDLTESACPEGTSFTVKDLFYNAPVRRKFLKKPSVETGYISDLMMRFILSHPQISFRYIADGKSVYFSAGDGRLESAVASVYGVPTLEKLRRISGGMSGIHVEGYVGIGELARGNRTHQSFILNGRLIKSALLTAALEDACRQRVMIGRFPICILHLTVPYENVDVNVHPNKWEVRFQNEPAVRQALQTLIAEGLQSDSPLAQAAPLFEDAHELPSIPVHRLEPASYRQKNINSEQKSKIFERNFDINLQNLQIEPVKNTKNIPEAAKVPSAVMETPSALKARSDSRLRQIDIPAAAFSANAYSDASAPLHPQKSRQTNQDRLEATVAAPDAPLPSFRATKEETKSPPPSEPNTEEQLIAAPVAERFESLDVRLLGVAFDTYIILECGDRLMLCDQHAVHERLLYEQFMRDSAGDAASQLLLTPIVLRLTHREYEIFLDSQQALAAAGFDASDFGDLSVQLRAVPMVLGNARSTECFRDALDEIAESGQISQEKRTERIIQMACKHAVKGGERAPLEALKGLIRRMISENVTPTCPHGRPLVIEVTRRELEKRFRRIQN